MELEVLLGELIRKINRLQTEVDDLKRAEYSQWQGAQAGDFTTTTLPNPGDFGYQNADDELQFNVGGSVKVLSDGAPGADGTTWYSGSGTPSGGLGVDDDYYLDTDTGDVYLKSGSWSVVVNIKGPTGATGAAGATGATGPQGDPGDDGLSGTPGLKYNFSTDTDSTPDTGDIQFNDSQAGSVTEIYAHTQDASGYDNEFTWGVLNGAAGYLYIVNLDWSKGVVFEVSSVAGTGSKVTFTGGSGFLLDIATIADNDEVYVWFVPEYTEGGASAPDTVTAATTNNDSGSAHTHAVTASDDPGAAVSLLKSDSNGDVTMQGYKINDTTTPTPSGEVGYEKYEDGVMKFKWS